MGNAYKRGRKSSNPRNLLCPYERLAFTLIARASADYSDITRQLHYRLYRDASERRSLKSRQRAYRGEFLDSAYIVNRLIHALPIFDNVTGEDLVARLDRVVREEE